jgi:hypothetical protein
MRELGRTFGYAERVKGYFAKTEQLGLAALARDNFFFRNNPGEESVVIVETVNKKGKRVKENKGVPIQYGFEPNWKVHFKPDTPPELFKVMVELLHIYDIEHSCVNNDVMTKIITSNLLEFDKLTDEFTRTQTTRVAGGLMKKEHQRPTLTKRSPLLLKQEMALVNKLLSPFWDDLDALKKDYLALIFEHSFKKLKAIIKGVFDRRWSILTSLGRLTTKRLQEVRVYMESGTELKKSAVSLDTLQNFILNRANSVVSATQELVELVPNGCLLKAVQEGLGKECLGSSDRARQHIANSLSIGYEAEGYIERVNAELPAIEGKEIEHAKEVTLCLKFIRRTPEIVGSVIRHTLYPPRRIEAIPSWAAVGEGLLKKIATLEREEGNFSERVKNDAIAYVSDSEQHCLSAIQDIRTYRARLAAMLHLSVKEKRVRDFYHSPAGQAAVLETVMRL